jgi:hypothetical protein
MKALAILATSVWFFMGCGARVGGAGSRAQGTSDAAPVLPVPRGTEDGGVPGVGPSDAHASDDQDSPPTALRKGPTVWVGQSNSTVTFPAGYDGGNVVPENNNPATGPEKVVLILDAENNPVIGTITFGDVAPPPAATDPNQPYPPSPTMRRNPNGQTFPIGAETWAQSPFPGFSYSLVSSMLSGNLLNLAFVPAQLWQGWCAIQSSSTQDASVASNDSYRPCDCDAGACTALSGPLRRLTLMASGDTMQGQLLLPSVPWPGGPPQIRLQRVQ